MNAALAGSLLQALATNALYSLILLAIVAPFAWLLRGRTPQLRQALWTIVLLRLVLPPSLALPTSFWGALAHWSGSGRPVLTMSVVTGLDAGPAATSALTSPPLFALWLSGAALVALATLRARRSLRRLAASARPVDDPRALRAFERAKSRVGPRRRVELLTVSTQLGTFTIGTLRPVVVVPAGVVASLSEEALECVLAHELVHVRRHDDLARQLLAVLQAVYFFNPAVWIAAAFRIRENELVCDGLAVTRGRLDPASYGRSIIEVLRLCSGPTPHAPMFLGRRNTMRQRIESVFSARPLSKAITAAAVVIGLAILPMSAGAGFSASDEPVEVKGDVVPPKVLTKVDPQYPPEARAEHLEGEVIVKATIGKDGRVSNVRATRSTRDDFAAATIAAARQWTFEPATLEGKPIAVDYALTFRFRLDGKKDKQ
jgi:TonB family protein